MRFVFLIVLSFIHRPVKKSSASISTGAALLTNRTVSVSSPESHIDRTIRVRMMNRRIEHEILANSTTNKSASCKTHGSREDCNSDNVRYRPDRDFCGKANQKSGRPLNGEALSCDQRGSGRKSRSPFRQTHPYPHFLRAAW